MPKVVTTRQIDESGWEVGPMQEQELSYDRVHIIEGAVIVNGMAKCRALFAVHGNDEPVQGWLSLQQDELKRLQTVEEFSATMSDGPPERMAQ